MIRTVFKNFAKSELAKQIVNDRLGAVLHRFPDSKESRITATLTMDNSPRQPGPDLFRVKVQFIGGRYHGLLLEKKAQDLYVALSDVAEHLLERLNRLGDRQRVRTRKLERKLSTT